MKTLYAEWLAATRGEDNTFTSRTSIPFEFIQSRAAFTDSGNSFRSDYLLTNGDTIEEHRKKLYLPPHNNPFGIQGGIDMDSNKYESLDLVKFVIPPKRQKDGKQKKMYEYRKLGHSLKETAKKFRVSVGAVSAADFRYRHKWLNVSWGKQKYKGYIKSTGI